MRYSFSVGAQAQPLFDSDNAGVSGAGEEQARVLAFIQSQDIKAIATKVMYKLFAMLEMKYDFKLSKDGETEETK